MRLLLKRQRRQRSIPPRLQLANAFDELEGGAGAVKVDVAAEDVEGAAAAVSSCYVVLIVKQVITCSGHS